MRDEGYKNFVLDPSIKPLKQEHKIAGQIFTIEGSSNTSYSHHETLLAWTGILSKAPSDKVLICQPNDNVAAFMGENLQNICLKKIFGGISPMVGAVMWSSSITSIFQFGQNLIHLKI